MRETRPAEQPDPAESSDGGTGGPQPEDACADHFLDANACCGGSSSPKAGARAEPAAEGGDISLASTGGGCGNDVNFERERNGGDTVPPAGPTHCIASSGACTREGASTALVACSRGAGATAGVAADWAAGEGMPGSNDEGGSDAGRDAGGGPVSRVVPGKALRPVPGHRTGVFDRLHAQHAKKLERLAGLREQCLQREAEQAEALVRTTWRPGSAQEVERVADRLYSDAAERRRRLEMRLLEREEQEHCGLEETLLPRKAAAYVDTGAAPCWERLYAEAPAKESRLEIERRRAAEEEELELKAQSVHKGTRDGEGLETFHRLYNDSLNRDLRKVQLQACLAEEEARELAEGSVHRSMKAIDLDECTRRLHEESRRRHERLEERRKKAEMEEAKKVPAAPAGSRTVASAADIDECTRRLHEESQRRAERLEERRRKTEAEDAEKVVGALSGHGHASVSQSIRRLHEGGRRASERFEEQLRRAGAGVEEAVQETEAAATSSSSGRSGLECNHFLVASVTDAAGPDSLLGEARPSGCDPQVADSPKPRSAGSTLGHRRSRVVRRSEASSEARTGNSIVVDPADSKAAPESPTDTVCPTGAQAGDIAARCVKSAQTQSCALGTLAKRRSTSATAPGQRGSASSTRGAAAAHHGGAATQRDSTPASPGDAQQRCMPGCQSAGVGSADGALRSSSQLVLGEATVVGQLITMTGPGGVPGVFAAWDAGQDLAAGPAPARRTVCIQQIADTQGMALPQEARGSAIEAPRQRGNPEQANTQAGSDAAVAVPTTARKKWGIRPTAEAQPQPNRASRRPTPAKDSSLLPATRPTTPARSRSPGAAVGTLAATASAAAARAKRAVTNAASGAVVAVQQQCTPRVPRRNAPDSFRANKRQ